MKNDFKILAIKKDTHKIIKDKANEKGMYMHRYIENLINKETNQ
jgi:hypothetical protein